jgi:hypothetical protein
MTAIGATAPSPAAVLHATNAEHTPNIGKLIAMLLVSFLK